MKKLYILLCAVFMSLFSNINVMKAFAKDFKDYEKIWTSESRRFNGMDFQSEFISNFDSWEEVKDVWFCKESWLHELQPLEDSAWFYEWLRAHNLTATEKDRFYWYWANYNDFSLEDGKLIAHAYGYREKNELGGYNYKKCRPEIHSGLWNGGKLMIENKAPYYFKVDGTKLVEVRFKVPKSNLCWGIYFMTVSNHFWEDQNKDRLKYKTEKGNFFEEIDMLELLTDDELTTESRIVTNGYLMDLENPVNGPQYFMNPKLYDNIKSSEEMSAPLEVGNVDDWCKEWHTFTAQIEPTKMICYMDGIKYKEISWKKKIGKINPDQEFMLFINPYWWTGTLYKDYFNIDAEDQNRRDYALDYVKIYHEVKK